MGEVGRKRQGLRLVFVVVNDSGKLVWHDGRRDDIAHGTLQRDGYRKLELIRRQRHDQHHESFVTKGKPMDSYLNALRTALKNAPNAYLRKMIEKAQPQPLSGDNGPPPPKPPVKS